VLERGREVEATHGGARARPARRVALAPESYVFGGMEIHVLQLLRRLDAERYEAVLLLPAESSWAAPPQRLVDEARGLGAAIVRYDDVTRRFLSRVRSILELRRLLGAHRIDLVHVHTSQPTRGSRLAVASRLGRPAGLVRTEHLPATAFPRSRRQRLASRVLDTLVDRIVVVSEQNRRSQVEEFGRSPDKVLVIRNGIEIDRYAADDRSTIAKERLGIDPTTPVIGAVGRLAPQKGIDTLIRAAATVSSEHAGLQVLLVGDGPSEDDLRALATELGIEDNVRFLGFQTDPAPYVEAMDVAVMPSRFEGLPLALLEYMAMGKACVVSDFPSMLEVVDDDVSALVVPIDDAAALAEHVGELLRSPHRIREIGQAARDRVEAAFDINREVVELMAVYDQVVT
jgi:glycosyltransferase involved in cell wall biosynthesis